MDRTWRPKIKLKKKKEEKRSKNNEPVLLYTWTVSSNENPGSFFIFFSRKLIASCSFRPALVAW